MAYGAEFRNGSGTLILGGSSTPVVVKPGSVSVSPEGSADYYRPPQERGSIAAFEMTSNINEVIASIRYTADETYLYGTTGDICFNDYSSIGSKTFRYLSLGTDVTFPSGGYGLEIRDASGNVTFNTNGVMFQPEDIVPCFYGQQVTIPNGKWVAIVQGYGAYPHSSQYFSEGAIQRVGTGSTWDVIAKDNGLVEKPDNGTLMLMLLTFPL